MPLLRKFGYGPRNDLIGILLLMRVVDYYCYCLFWYLNMFYLSLFDLIMTLAKRGNVVYKLKIVQRNYVY